MKSGIAALEHVINIILSIVVSFVTLELLLFYKAQKISNVIVPIVNGEASYEDIDIQTWLNSFDTLLYILVGVVLLAIIIRYIIESMVITHEKTALRSFVFALAVLIAEMFAVIYFFKAKAPILEGDTGIILILVISMMVLFYILLVAFVPSCIKYLLFPRNILVRKR